MATVKANGYGHGAIPVARRLVELGADYLAVACLEEGAALRRAGIMSRNWVPALSSRSGSWKEIWRCASFSPAQAHLAIQPRWICSMQAVTADTGVSPECTA